MRKARSPKIMSVDAAKDSINSYQSIARRYQAAFITPHAELEALKNQLALALHDDRHSERQLSPLASLAHDALKSAGKWPNMEGMARDAANRAVSEFLRNPLNWKAYEPLGSYMRRATDFRGKDCLREEYPHLNGRVENEQGVDAEGAAWSILASQADTRNGNEQDADDLKLRVLGIIKTMPDRRKIIATERLLKPDGLTGKALAERFEMSEGWVAGELRMAEEMIRQELSMGA